MSAHLTDQDCINALATFWYEYHKTPGNESPQNALERAFLIAKEEVSIKKDYFENQNELRYRAIRLIEAQKDVYKGLASCRVIYDILLNENIRSLQALYPDDIKEPLDITVVSIANIPDSAFLNAFLASIVACIPPIECGTKTTVLYFSIMFFNPFYNA